MYIQNYIRFVESHIGIRMGCEVIDQVVGIFCSCFCGFRFMSRGGGKGHEVIHVDFADVV